MLLDDKVDPPIHTEYFLTRSNISKILMTSTAVFETLSFQARRTDRDSENNCAASNRIFLVDQVLQPIRGHDPVTTAPLTWSGFATAAAAVAAVWHGRQLTPMNVCCYVVRLLLLPRIPRESSRLHFRWRLSALRYHNMCNSVWWQP